MTENQDIFILEKEDGHYYLCKEGSRYVYATTDQSYIGDMLTPSLHLEQCLDIFVNQEAKKLGENYSRMHQDVSGSLGRYLVSACYQDGYETAFDKMFTLDEARELFRKGMQWDDYTKDVNEALEEVIKDVLSERGIAVLVEMVEDPIGPISGGLRTEDPNQPPGLQMHKEKRVKIENGFVHMRKLIKQ
jgi:hypothetical protein